MSDGRVRHDGIHLPPPLIYLVFLAAGLIANLYYPLPLSASETIVLLIPGLVIVVIGLSVGAVALRAMRRAGVSPLPWRTPGKLVVDGPFRFSRNPLYVSLAVMYLGIAIAVNALWPLAFVVLPIVIVDRRTILQEEKFLEKTFGEEYRSYKARVRRWI